MKRKRKQWNKKKLAAASTAAVTAGALVVGGLFAEPAELLEPEAAEGLVETAVMEEDGDELSEERRGPRQRLRDRILALPLLLRAGVFLPLWALGWGLSQLLPLLAQPLGVGAALLGSAAAAAKLIRPELPLKAFFSRRSIGLLLLMMGLLWGADVLLPLVWENYDRFRQLLWALLSLGCGAALLLPIKRKDKPIPPETQEEALRRVLEMADEAGRR